MAPPNHYDVIIVGGGIIGMSAAYQLSKWNKNILLLEQVSMHVIRSCVDLDPSLICVPSSCSQSVCMYPEIRNELNYAENIQ